MTPDASQNDIPPELREKFRINEACERFEDVWKAGPPKPQIADYIADWGEPSRSNLLRELLLIEWHHRRRKDEEPTPEQYDALLPEYAALIREVFADDKSHEFTKPWRGEGEPAKDSPDVADAPERQRDIPATEIPETIGRYRIEKVLGKGGFGLVYLAHDEQLDRRVAIKVPHAKLISGPEDAEAYLTEARTVANLDHPNIVPVHDVGSTDDCPCYMVSKYIEGTDLAAKLKQSRLKYTDAAELVATVAEALHYAHKQGLVHRDVKPGNILIGTDGEPYVVDFGLALREENIGKGPKHAGTPAYMSPEQARGEGHRVDGRSDIFSLGVVFYELLVGNRPLKAESRSELLQLIATVEVRPPRQVNDRIPKELERICLKTLSMRATDRYTTAKDLAEDLRHFLSTAAPQTTPAIPVQGSPTPSTLAGETQVASDTPAATPDSDSQPIKIVPKGLRSFDAHDAEFFLELLPGPRDREGLPDSLRFWKTRIEETDPDNTFSVGLIYGPSGCGKSSLVKAGLLPRLSDDVMVVYVEATAGETEARLLHGLRKRCSALPANLDLPQTLAALRRGQGVPATKKVLIVLDQFEQWLHARKDEENTELVQALRQCDGGNVQCIVMVRDDFWMAVTRFLAAVEVELVQGDNFAAVDLFDCDHASKVLAAFGRAFSKLPENVRDTTEKQKGFIKQAVTDLAEEGKVICVRLALFSEMMKVRPWTLASLRQVGGTQGVGVTFLEETFSSQHTAVPKHRLHQKAARAVLKALLPESGSNIKGHMRSYVELLEASGYALRPRDFDDLIRILDSEIRLITPTDPEGIEPDDDSVTQTEAGQKYYQLTHDYLVPSLHDWLTRKQKETRKGRAELRLAGRSALWNAKPENRHLPSLWEWASIRTLTDKKKWSGPQRKMMGKAERLHGVRSGLAGLGIVLVVFAGLFVAGRVEERQNANYAKALVESLSAANTADVGDLVGEIGKYQRWATPLLQEIVVSEDSNPKQKLHASLVLVKDDPSHVDFLFQRLLDAEPEDVPVIVRFLNPHRGQLDKRLWDTIVNGSNDERIRAAAAQAAYDSKGELWGQVCEDVVTALMSVPSSESDEWIEMLRPVGSVLADPLEQRFKDRSPERDSERSLAALALADYLKDDPKRLTELVLLANNDREFQPLLLALRNHRKTVVDELESLLSQSPPDAGKQATDVRDAFWKKQANAAICLLELGDTEFVWPLFQQTPDPSLRSFLIDRIALLGANHETLAAQIRQESDPASRYALILALGSFDLGNISSQRRHELLEQFAALYRDDHDSGVHSAAAWMLRNWQQEQVTSEIDDRLSSSPANKDWNWFVNSQGQTYIVVNGPVEFLMGEKSDMFANVFTEPKKVTLSHRFAIATLEVTVVQFQKFRSDHSHISRDAPEPDCPVNHVSWYDAVAYCNWLSEQEGIPQNQWCYEKNDKGEYAEGMTIPANYLERTGYRLPTDEEWEFVCRANSTSLYGFGEPLELLTRYAWYDDNSKHRTWPVGTKMPNGLGVFDMHGNAWEWCNNEYNVNERQPDGESRLLPGSSKDGEPRLLRGGSFVHGSSNVRSAYRILTLPGNRFFGCGFRPARTYNLSP